MDERPTYIYVLCEPDGETVRYVGKTVNPKQRYTQHSTRYENEKHRNHKCNWILSLLRRGEKPIMHIVEVVPPNEDWATRERYWIEYHRNIGCRLTNLAEGGQGASGVVHSEETKAKMRKAKEHISDETRARLSESMRGNTNFAGHRHTPEVMERIASKNRGQKRSAETKALWSAQRTGRKQSPETIEKRRRATLATKERKRREREHLAKEQAS